MKNPFFRTSVLKTYDPYFIHLIPSVQIYYRRKSSWHTNHIDGACINVGIIFLKWGRTLIFSKQLQSKQKSKHDDNDWYNDQYSQ